MKQKRTFYFLLFIFILGLLTGLLWPKKSVAHYLEIKSEEAIALPIDIRQVGLNEESLLYQASTIKGVKIPLPEKEIKGDTHLELLINNESHVLLGYLDAGEQLLQITLEMTSASKETITVKTLVHTTLDTSKNELTFPR